MKNKKIGMFDSGVGGLTVLKSAIKEMPNEDFLYFGDTGRVPYGNKPVDTLIRYTRDNINFMLKNDVKAIIVACGTVSSILSEEMMAEYDIPIIKIIEPTSEIAAKTTKNKKVGLIATESTIKNKVFENAIKNCDDKIEVYTNSCQEFVALAEAGKVSKDDEYVRKVVSERLNCLKSEGVDTLVLGCTHFPILSEAITDFMGENVELVDASSPTSVKTKEVLDIRNSLSQKETVGKTQFYVSGKKEGFIDVASHFLHTCIEDEVFEVSI